MIELGIYFLTLLLVVMIPFMYWRKHKNHIEVSGQKYDENLKSGLVEPVTLHPKIDPNRCIMAGACVSACPEGEILGIVKGRAQIIAPNKCIGHGACQSACPTDAISLIFGTKTRGVDIPEIRETFETNVRGVYIAGELGGMGLVRNAITQGKEAVEYISKSLKNKNNGNVDLLIVGSGPAGLAASLQAKKENLNFLILEQEHDFGGTVFSFPRQKLVMTQPMDIPLYGKFKQREIQKEALLDLWKEITEKNNIAIKLGEKVETITNDGELFQVVSTKNTYSVKKVLLAIGRRGTPRKLGVVGEATTKVAYKLIDPEQYKNKHILVVGGGDSAVESALRLGEQEGTTVTLSYRKDQFSRIKEKNKSQIDAAVKAGWVNILFESQVISIDPQTVTIKHKEESVTLQNDFLFVLIGGELPTAFLKNIGIDMETKFGVK